MPKHLSVRALTEEEERVIEKLVRSQTASVRLVQRARIIRLSHQGSSVAQIAQQMQIDEDVVRKWIRRFGERGLAGLEDAPRSGAPSRYTPENKARILQAARTRPTELGLPFGSWTFDRLTTYVHEHHGVQMKRTRIIELLHEEGLRWHKQETWFGERLDPEFAEKRGPSSASAAKPQLGA
jgi:transposase